jgi:hypothetical protein
MSLVLDVTKLASLYHNSCGQFRLVVAARFATFERELFSLHLRFLCINNRVVKATM